MNKREFVRELADRTNMSNAKAMEVTNAILEIISEKLKEREKIGFVGFGTLEARQFPERTAINPRTKESMVIPKRYKAVFKSSKVLMGELNKR